MAPFMKEQPASPLGDGHGKSGYYQSNESPKESESSASPEPIAVCGMALRLPGGITNPEEFWNFLVEMRDARSRIPKSRYNIAGYHSMTGKPGTIKTEYGYFLDVDLGQLDTSFFSMPKVELERADPQQRQLLEVTRECFESAGEVDYRGKDIGCFVGSFGEDWCEMFAKEAQQHGLYRITGYGDLILSNRLSYEYDLKGPSLTIRTGCSASLTALHEACLAIGRGECSSAIVAGTNLIMAPGMTAAMTEQGVLSPNGSCRTFDADADGYARGEAINAVYIKPLSYALRDGNPIRAVIRATSVNCDGKTPGISNPSSESHEALIRHTYALAGITDFSKTAFVECHGTGTAIGDPLEAMAVANVFGDKGVYIGSVKPNVGHSEGASGVTSLIKCILALEHRIIPPNIKFSKPNPKIPFEARRLTVPCSPTEWPKDASERISINSFGIGGANAHIIIDSTASFIGNISYPHISASTSESSDVVSAGSSNAKTTPPELVTSDSSEVESLSSYWPRIMYSPRLMVYSANTQESLRRQVTNMQKYLELYPARAADLAYTLAVKREHLPHRAFSVVGESIAPNTFPFAKVAAGHPDIVMVFTGQGAQWPQMGKDLIDTNDTFRNSVHTMDGILQKLPDAPEWLIVDELKMIAEKSNIQKARFSQPLCTALQVALVDALAAINIQPSAVVGHSSGEIAAAYAAGRISMREAIIAAYQRGKVSLHTTRPGGMAAIGMGWKETTPYLIDGVLIACENSPSSVTISGDLEAVKEVVNTIKASKPDTLARLLKVDKAYHSHHMKALGSDYHSLTKGQVFGSGALKTVTFFSSVTGKQLTDKDTLDALYLQKNLESPVLFSTAVTNLVAHIAETDAVSGQKSNLVFLEIGPHSALQGPLRQILAQTPAGNYLYVPTILRGKNCAETFLSCVGQLHIQNAEIDFRALTNPEGTAVILHDLPTYPWQHDTSYWYESRLSKEWRHRVYPHHDILGLRVSESTENEPAWRNLFHLNDAPWVRDHCIRDDIVFPCAGYIGIAGEAVRQLAGSTAQNEGPFCGFSLRRVMVSTAMVLTEGKPTEIITSLKRIRLTDSLDSTWWEFSISSYNGTAWLRHCSGQVRARRGNIPSGSPENYEPLPRKVSTSNWYSTMRRVGLNYGPFFQGLTDISAATTYNVARARTFSTAPDEVTYYPLHPTTIDFFLQLLSVATTKGLSRNFKTLTVPTDIDEIDVYTSGSENPETRTELNMAVSASGSPKGVIRGNGECVSACGDLALRMKGIRLSPLEEGGALNPDPHAAATVHWQPDIDFLDIPSLIVPSADRSGYAAQLAELNSFCVAESLHLLEGSTASYPHMENFRNWLERQPQPDERNPSEYNARIRTLSSVLLSTPAAPAVHCMLRISHNVRSIFEGTVDPLELLLAGDALTQLYNYMDDIDRRPFLQALGHSKPNLRVLEIGAGTGGTTNTILQSLIEPNSNRHTYAKYTYTDISVGFFPAAKKRFEQWPNIEYRSLDISKDPIAQGFEPQSYDLILATNVLHATPSLQETLTNVHKLLAPDGRLLMHELHTEQKWINFIMGVLPGWWLGGSDARPDEPYVSPERWSEDLKKAGFKILPAVVLDSQIPNQLNAAIIAQPLPRDAFSKSITLLCYRDSNAADKKAMKVKQALEEYGFDISICSPNEAPPQGKDVVSLLDIDTPFFKDISQTNFELLQGFVAQIVGAGIFWITRRSQIDCKDPRFAQSIGAARAIRSDLSLDFATCEVEDIDNDIFLVLKVLKKFLGRAKNESMKPELEYVISDDQVLIPRWRPFSVTEELVKINAVDDKQTAMTLDIGKYGRLSTLRWADHARPPLRGGDVEVQTCAVGMNFKDVLIAMGIVDSSTTTLGIECAGIICRMGSNVKDFQVGDRVIVIGAGCFATTLITSEKLCARMPDDLSFEDAATMPCVYATVIYSLIEIGRMERGQSILIHSACGGVGIAAIQIVRMLGADLYVTVGNDEKAQYLMSTFGIERDRIFNSRDASFLQDVLQATGGRGVDFVLNSLSGELLHASWECVAEFGMLLEIGKRDLIGHGKLAMDIFEANRTYSGIDLGLVIERKPHVTKRLLETIMKFYKEGHIQPIKPLKVFKADAVEDCFRYMQKGQHIGKIVVSMSDVSLCSTKVSKRISLKPDAAYLLCGGLGGLGKAVSTWMAENGARMLVYLSRSAGDSAEDQAFLKELESQGCSAVAVKGSVSSQSDVQRAIASTTTPLKGVLQMTMVLRDQAFAKMTYDEWNEAVIPKVKGTWNLHRATANQDLDFFVLFSSISGIWGNHGQANYASANTFLDSFVQYRHGLGLAASVMDIGMMEDTGYVADNPAILARMVAAGDYGIREPHLLDGLTIAMTSGKPTGTGFSKNMTQFMLGLRSTLPLTDRVNRQVWRRDRRAGLLHSDGQSSGGMAVGSTNDKLRDFLLRVTGDPYLLKQPSSTVFIAQQIAAKLYDFILKPVSDDSEIDISASLQDSGMDSLVAIEMKAWWKQRFQFDISVLEMLAMGTFEELGKHAVKGLLEKTEGGSGQNDPGYLAMKAP